MDRLAGSVTKVKFCGVPRPVSAFFCERCAFTTASRVRLPPSHAFFRSAPISCAALYPESTPESTGSPGYFLV